MTTNGVATKNITEAEKIIQEYKNDGYYNEMSLLQFVVMKELEKKKNTQEFEYESIPIQNVKSR